MSFASWGRAGRRVVAARDPYDDRGLLKEAVCSPDEATAEIRALLTGLSPRELVGMDELVRERHWWSTYTGVAGGPIEPAEVPALAPLGVHAVGLASFHANGHVREAAVRELAAIRDGSELPYLLIRLNDWVIPVRRRAYDAVLARLTPEYAPWFVRDLWLVLRLAWCGREDHTAFMETASAFLAGPGRAALVGGLDSPDRWLRRTCYRMLLDPLAEDAAEIVARAVEDGDGVIVLRGVRRAGEVLPPERLAEVLPTLVRHRLPAARAEALALWTRRFPATVEPELRRALLDPGAALRAMARRALGAEDFAAVYRAALDGATGPALRTALAGLGETGSADDAARVLPHLSSRTASVRAAAITALARLAPDESTARFVAALDGANAGVSKAARLALEPRVWRAGAEALWILVQNGREHHVKKNALALLASLGRWESITWLLRARAAGDPAVAQLADSMTIRWLDRFNHGVAQPSKEQIERAKRALDEVEPMLGAERARMLRFLMKGYD